MVGLGALASELVLATFTTGDVIAIAGLLAAAGGAWLAYRQLVAGKRVARAQFLLDLDEAFVADEPIRARLGQKTEGGRQEPLNRDEWRQVKRYMGRLERVGIFVSERLLDREVVRRLYGPRVKTIVMNDEIRGRLLEAKAVDWIDFVRLWQRLDKMEMERAGGHLCEHVPKSPPWPLERGTEQDRGPTSEEDLTEEA